MKKARMNISHSRFILFKLKIFGEIVTTFTLIAHCSALHEVVYKWYQFSRIAVFKKDQLFFLTNHDQELLWRTRVAMQHYETHFISTSDGGTILKVGGRKVYPVFSPTAHNA